MFLFFLGHLHKKDRKRLPLRIFYLVSAEKDTAIDVSFDEINSELDRRVNLFVDSFGSIASFEKNMKMTTKELKQEYWETVKEELLVEKYKFFLFGDVSVSSREVSSFYEAYQDSFPPSPALFSGSIIELPIQISSLSRDSLYSLASLVKDSLEKMLTNN